MSHSSTTASRSLETTASLDARNTDDLEQRPVARPAARPVGATMVGWRYGSALAAARALNERPVEA